MYVLISRIEGPELLGQYSLVLAWVLLFQALATFGIPEFLLREIGKSRDRGEAYAGQGLAVGSVTTVVAVLIMGGAVSILYGEEMRWALLLGTLFLPSAVMGAICRACFIAQGRTRVVFLLALAETLCTLPVNVALILHHGRIIPLIATLVAGKFVVSLLALSLFTTGEVRSGFSLRSAFSKELLSPLFSFAMSGILGLISIRLNLILLSLFGTLAAVGQFAAASKLLGVLLIIPSVVAQMALPRYAAHFSGGGTGGEARDRTLLSLLFASVFPLAVGVTIFAPLLMSLLFTGEFLPAVPIVRILMLYAVIETADAMMGVTLKAAGHQRDDLRLYSFNPFVNVLLGLASIPAFGGLGAAGAKLAGALCSSLSRYRFIIRRRLPLPLSADFWLPIAASALAGLCLVGLGWDAYFITTILYAMMAGLFLHLGYRLIGSRAPWLLSP
jgi:O-antigen/teichoic acid export membrane protein